MTPFGKFDFSLEAFDSCIHVECNDAETFDALERYIFPPFLRNRSAEQVSPEIELRIDRNVDGFDVLMNRQFVATATTLDDAVLAAVKALDDAVVHRMTRFRAVHAGAVLIDGRALLFPGSSHAGKSSLVAELLRRGAACLSDEYALVDEAGLIHSYPRPLLLRNGRPRQSLFLPEDLNTTFATGPAPAGWILAVDYVPPGAWNVREIPQGEGVMLLLRNTPHGMSESPKMVDFFRRAAAQAVCYEGQRCDVSEAATHIINLLRCK